MLLTQPATVLEDYARLLALLKIEPTTLEDIVLLPYSTGTFPQPGNFTTPWQLEGTVLGLRALGASRISLLGRKPSNDDLMGLALTARRLGLTWQADPGSAKLLVLLPTLRRVPAARLGATLWLAAHAVRNDHYPGLRQHFRLEQTMEAQLLERIPTLAVVDATTVGNGARDRSDRPQVANLLLASRDVVAVDAIGAQLLGLDGLRDVSALANAQQLRLGIADLAQIELCGDLAAARLRFPACPPHMPWRSRSSYMAWRYETSWGKLFSRYHVVNYTIF